MGNKGKKRPVYVNGLYCESMADAARQSSVMSGGRVHLYQVQRILNGGLTVKGIEVKEQPVQKLKAEDYTPPVKRHNVLLRYPKGEAPMDRGLPPQWR